MQAILGVLFLVAIILVTATVTAATAAFTVNQFCTMSPVCESVGER